MGYKVAVVGATGNVGREMLQTLDERDFPAKQVVALASERSVANETIALPSLDIITLGAGGGSIAKVGASGLLQVGPQSAGAEPGPASYGRGGTAG